MGRLIQVTNILIPTQTHPPAKARPRVVENPFPGARASSRGRSLQPLPAASTRPRLDLYTGWGGGGSVVPSTVGRSCEFAERLRPYRVNNLSLAIKQLFLFERQFTVCVYTDTDMIGNANPKENMEGIGTVFQAHATRTAHLRRMHTNTNTNTHE